MEDNKDILEKLRSLTNDNDCKIMNENDTFGFKCKQCGQCCMNRDDIILNPFDVYNAAKFLGITPEKFIDDNCYCSLGGNSKIPIVLLKSKDNGFCPLLKFDIKDGGKFKCTINEAKPGACSNHPIGVSYMSDCEMKSTKLTYLKVSQCPNSVSDEMHTVKDWVKPYTDHIDDIEVAHRIQLLSNKYFPASKFYAIINFINKMYEKDKKNGILPEEINDDFMPENIFRHFVSNTIEIGYTNYDISKPFIEQAEENIKSLDELYSNISSIYSMIEKLLPGLPEKLLGGDENGNN